MPDIDNFNISFLTNHPLPVIVAFIIIFILSIYLYRRTNPPITKLQRWLLTSLRLIALLCLFVALAEPVISYTNYLIRIPRTTVLIDNSLSMEKIEDGKSRATRINEILSGKSFENINRNTDVSLYYFGSNLTTDPSEVANEATAIGDVLTEAKNIQLSNPADYTILLSDGNSNSGVNPILSSKNYNTPLYTVDVSGGEGDFDIGLTDVEYNNVIFVGQDNKIKVKLNWQNSPKQNLTVSISESNQVVSRKSIKIDQDQGIGEVELDYRPSSPGEKLIKLEIPLSDNEQNRGNNSKTIAVKVLKSKLKVLLSSEYLDYELGFLKRTLDKLERYDVELRLTGNQSGNLGQAFPSRQTELNQFDLVIIYDPNPIVFSSKIELLKSYLTDKNGSVWVMMGEKYGRSKKDKLFNQLLPFSSNNENVAHYHSFTAEPVESQLYHPVVRLADNQTSIRKLWNDLPPFELLVGCDEIDSEAEILAEAFFQGKKYPLIGFKRFGGGKLMATAAAPFWHWSFITLGYGEDNQVYDNFIDGSVSWLSVDTDTDPIRINPDKKVYHRGETVLFNGFAYDLGYRPLPEVNGSVSIATNDDQTIEVDLLETEAGKFRAELNNLPPGDYNYTGKFEKDSRVLKTVNGSFRVESFSKEEFDRSPKREMLQGIANSSGGQFYSHENFEKILDQINLDKIEESKEVELKLRGKWWLLLLFILALSLEWLIRKFNQLI